MPDSNEGIVDPYSLAALVYNFIRIDFVVGATQGIALLFVSVLGAVLLFHPTRRHSDMHAAYADIATLATIGTTDPTFLRTLSNLTGQDTKRARSWREYLSKQRIYLGDIEPRLDQIVLQKPNSHYGFYFGPFKGATPIIGSSSGNGSLQQPKPKPVYRWIL